MLVHVIEGDLLTAPRGFIIGHQVNCQGVMGAGVALAIAQRYPCVESAYKEFVQNHNKSELLGMVHICSGEIGRHIVANLFAQQQAGYGRQTNYEALYGALRSLEKFGREQEIRVALPYKIGCGLAGGSWPIVSAMIEDIWREGEVWLYRMEG